MKPIRFKTDGSDRRGFLLEAGPHNSLVILARPGPLVAIEVENVNVIGSPEWQAAEDAKNPPASEPARGSVKRGKAKSLAA